MTRTGLYFTHSLPLKDEIRYARLAMQMVSIARGKSVMRNMSWDNARK